MKLSLLNSQKNKKKRIITQSSTFKKEKKNENENEKSPRKQSAAIAAIFSGAASFHVSFAIGLDGVFLGAAVAFILLLAVFPAEVLLNSGEIAKGSRRVVVDAGGLRADIHALPHFLTGPLPELPRKVVAAAVELQILVALEPLAADLAHESVRCQQRFRR